MLLNAQSLLTTLGLLVFIVGNTISVWGSKTHKALHDRVAKTQIVDEGVMQETDLD